MARGRPIADFDDPRATIPDYLVRDDGTVARHDRHRRAWIDLRPKIGPGGHVKVRLRIHGVVREIGVALLVLRAFVGPRPHGFEPFHFPDPDLANNRLENLRWVPRGTSKQGRLLAAKPPPPPRGAAHPHANLVEADVQPIRDLYRSGVGYREIAELYGVSPESVRKLLVGETWSHVPDPAGPIVMRRRGPASGDCDLAKLDWDLVDEIRGHLAAGLGPKKVAGLYDVSPSTIRDVAKGRTWKTEDRPADG